MSIDARATGYGKIFGDWTLHEMIGKGSNGKTAVFRVTRSNRTYKEKGAMKVVNIMEQRGKKEELSGMFLQDYEKHCEMLCTKAENELKLMSDLRICGNIVNYHDHRFEEWEDEYNFGMDLLIRMDLLESLEQIKKTKDLQETEIIKIGMDICDALICCHNNNLGHKEIIHRDIKPDNIFYNKSVYMLGDFGISKMVDETNSAETSTGTRAYAAPEQFAGKYDSRVDIYSLGLTLYELANGNKLPFAMSPFVSPDEIQLRINGKPLPKPEHASEAFTEVILKACAYKPQDRYQTAAEFKHSLEQVQLGVRKIYQGAPLQEKQQVEKIQKPMEAQPDMYATAPALRSEVEEVKAQPDMYATAPALRSEVEEVKAQSDMYATAPALRSEVEEVKVQPDMYATAPALRSEVEEVITQPDMYVTAPVSTNEEKQAMTVVEENESISDEIIVASHLPEEQKNVQIDVQLDEVEDIPMFAANTSTIDMFAVGRDYYEKGDYAKAVDWYQQAASIGNTEAMYELANCFMNGIGVEKNLSAAEQMYTNCAEKCSDRWIRGLAEFRIGQIYEKEYRTKQDCKIAEEWYRKSAADGNPYAMKRFHRGKFIKE